MLAKPAACEGCPAFELGTGFVPWQLRATPNLVLIGQGPGRDEAHQGVPFVGRSGNKLNWWLAESGWQRALATVGNIVLCWLRAGTSDKAKDRPPTRAEWSYCLRAHWAEHLRALPPGVPIVFVGVPAAKAFLGDRAGERSAGSVATFDLQEWLREHAPDPDHE